MSARNTVVSSRRPLTVVLTLLMTAAFLVTLAPAAEAQRTCAPGELPRFDPDTGRMTCVIRVTNPGNPGGGGGGGGGGGTTPWPPPGYVLVEWPSGSSEEDGTPCIQRNSRWIPEEERSGYLDSYHRQFFMWYERLDYDFLPDLTDCTSQPGEPQVDPAVVQAMIEEMLVPPQPRIDPGRGLTGLPSYLDINGLASDSNSVTLPIGMSFEWSGTAQYRVEWGDGTTETVDATHSGPYPSGQVTHVYGSTGDYTVTVTPVWTITWTFEGTPIEFTAELTSQTVALPVGEVQAVRTN